MLNGNDRRQPFSGIVSLQRFFIFFQIIIIFRIVVDHARQRQPETLLMGPAFLRIDIITERVNIRLISIIILQSNFHKRAFFFTFNINNLFMNRCFILVDKLDIFPNPAFIMKGHCLIFITPLIIKDDFYPLIKKSQLA
ncbi:hypothetical protein SDC9_132306 [bioreactor metagenome]|uniref:Uncharacterized protein n=1 Tax=bioreactor metagenome TaxID=1076179 RepID=A0A645D840_9ZZZZ